jgi:hypothetical protein
VSDPAAKEPACVWCGAGEDRYVGCCGRANPHHHTVTQARDGLRIIPNDDCVNIVLVKMGLSEEPTR